MNPFLQSLKVDVVRVTKEKKLIDAEKSGDIVLDYYDYSEGQLFEKQRYTKWYRSEGIDEVVFYQLKGSSKDVLWYIMNHLRPDSDRIELQTEKLSGAIGVSKPTIIHALQLLCEAGLICKSERRSVYWINPYYIFSGNRIKYLNKVNPACLTTIDYQ